MVTHVKVTFKGPGGYGLAETRGWNEELYETRQRLVQRTRETFGKRVKIELVYQAEVFYEAGTGRELRRIVY